MEAFLRLVPTNTTEYKANKKLQRLMEKYLQRKERQAKRQQQVSHLELLLVENIHLTAISIKRSHCFDTKLFLFIFKSSKYTTVLP
jgi:hypothetical protein